MTDIMTPDRLGKFTARDTLEIQRLLPGPVERIWAYLTEGGMRRRWLAAGEMTLEVGAPFELTWRNDELTDPPGARPPGFAAEQSMQSRITEVDPPRRLAFTWGEHGLVSFDLKPAGGRVLLTVVHSGLPDRATTLMIGAGWHMHLEILEARAEGTAPEPFWDGWVRLRDAYDRIVPA